MKLDRGHKLRIAVINHDFWGFTGSEIVALEVANHYAARGHQVTIRAERHSENLLPYIHPNVTVAQSRIDIAEFDFVWDQHGHFCLNAADLKQLRTWKGRFVSVHLSGITPAATYSHPFATRFVKTRVFNSESSRILLEEGKECIGRSYNFKNSAPHVFHVAPGQAKKQLKNLLLVSNHPPAELIEALNLLRQSGVNVKHIGLDGEYRIIIPKDIENTDAVVTIGKTVQYALCSGKPVYCYDHFGGPGWLSEENFSVAEFHNFSGRCCKSVKASGQILGEILDHFEMAEEFAINKWSDNCQAYDLDKFLDLILIEAEPNSFDSEKCTEEIDAMRGPLMHLEWIWEDVYSKGKTDLLKATDRILQEKEDLLRHLDTKISQIERDNLSMKKLISSINRKRKKYRRAFFASSLLLILVSLLIVVPKF